MPNYKVAGPAQPIPFHAEIEDKDDREAAIEEFMAEKKDAIDDWKDDHGKPLPDQSDGGGTGGSGGNGGGATQVSTLVNDQSDVPINLSTHSNLDIENFEGIEFYYNSDKPLILDGDSPEEKLSGVVTSANESVVFFFETNTGFNYLVKLEGEFDKNYPSTDQDIKGTVSSVSLILEGTPYFTLIVYDSPRDVQDVLNNWYNNFLDGDQDNLIEVVSLQSSDDYVNAGAGDDVIDLGAGDDTLIGGDGNDLLYGGAGDDQILGGSGIDTAVYLGSSQNYEISITDDALLVFDSLSEDSDTLTGVERLQFDDVSIAYDLDGNAGFAAKLLGVILGSESVSNEEYVGIVLWCLDSGTSYEEVMQLALDAVLGADASSESVVSLLYENIVGSDAPAEILEEYCAVIDDGVMSAAQLVVAAADTSFNTDNIGLVGLSQTGLEFDLYG